MSNKKKFYDFHVEKPRKDILENLKEFETFYTREIERDEYAYRRALKTPTSSNGYSTEPSTSLLSCGCIKGDFNKEETTAFRSEVGPIFDR